MRRYRRAPSRSGQQLQGTRFADRLDPVHLPDVLTVFDVLGSSAGGMVDRTGNVLDPATVGGGSNSPLWLPYNDVPRTWNGAVNYIALTTPPVPAGVATFVFDGESTDWNTVTFAKHGGIDAGSYSCAFVSNGAPALLGAGSAIVSSGHPASGRVQWRCKRNANTSAEVAWRTDGVTDPAASGWTVSAIGSITDQGDVTTIVGDNGFTGSSFAYGMDVYDGATLIASFDPAYCGQTGYVDPVSGKTWTAVRAASGRKLVVQSPAARSANGVWLYGPDDYHIIPTAAAPPMLASSSFSAFAVVRRWEDSVASFPYVFALGSDPTGVDAGVGVFRNGTNGAYQAVISDGSVNIATLTPVADTPGALEFVCVNVNPTTLSLHVNNASTSQNRAAVTGDSTPAACRLGSAVGGAPDSTELLAFGTATRELTATERAQFMAFYGVI